MLDYKLVITRYKENIDWVTDYDNYTIFNKGNPNELSEQLLQHTHNLQNVGKDVDVILSYIVNNYNSLPPKIAFCQGSHGEHYPLPLHDFMQQLLTLNNGYSTLDYRYHRVFEFDRNHGTFNKSHWPDQNHPLGNYHPNYNLAAWWKQLSGEDYVQKDIVFWGCIFCVERELIHRRPLAFYQKMHSYFTNHVNPVETHFAERTWANIFFVGKSC
jgi:hypothetical protein